jgi:acetolactate synthase I/II/III large subunit
MVSSPTLLISAVRVNFDPDPGGLYMFDGQLSRLDSLSTTGLWADDRGLARIVCQDAKHQADNWLLAYDKSGLVHLRLLADMNEPHDVLWERSGNDPGYFIIVSTGSNTVHWRDASGVDIRTWQAPGQGDSWHMNCVTKHDGRLYLSGFCKRLEHRAWDHVAEGFVMDLDAGTDIVSDLRCPHNPRYFDGAWAVCDSGNNRVIHGGRIVELESWTRGLAVTDKYLYVGESVPRDDAKAKKRNAAIAVIDRKQWAVVDRIPLPFLEVYDIVVLNPDLLNGVRGGLDACTAAVRLNGS